MKVYVIFVLVLTGFVACSASDQLNDKKSTSKPEKMEPTEEMIALNMNKSDQQSGIEVASELSGIRKTNGRKQKADTDNSSIDQSKNQPSESSILLDQQNTIDLFNKYLEKYGAEIKNNNKGLTFEDLIKHLEKDELMLLTKAYEVLANGHGNLVKKLKEHALTTTTTTTTAKPPIYQSKSLRYRPKYKKLSSKQATKQDPTLFFINNGHIYSIKRHS